MGWRQAGAFMCLRKTFGFIQNYRDIPNFASTMAKVVGIYKKS